MCSGGKSSAGRAGHQCGPRPMLDANFPKQFSSKHRFQSTIPGQTMRQLETWGTSWLEIIMLGWTILIYRCFSFAQFPTTISGTITSLHLGDYSRWLLLGISALALRSRIWTPSPCPRTAKQVFERSSPSTAPYWYGSIRQYSTHTAHALVTSSNEIVHSFDIKRL